MWSWSRPGYEVVILDNFSNSRPDVLDRLEVITGAPVTCYTGDVRDRALLDRIFAEHGSPRSSISPR